MDSKELSCWSLLFHLLIVLGSCGSDHSASSQMTDPERLESGKSLLIFPFEDLTLGKEMRMYFPDGDPNPLSSPYLWTKEQADAIPFSLAKLPEILQRFSIPQGSREALVLQETLESCEREPLKGETMACLTSRESLVDFALRIYGSDSDIQLLSSRFLNRPDVGGAVYQNYTIVEAPEYIAPRMIGCHPMNYPFMCIFCHHFDGKNPVYRIALSGENGERVEAIAACHMDTSHWKHHSIPFLVLGIKPGTTVCHFFPPQHFVLVPSDLPLSSSI